MTGAIAPDAGRRLGSEGLERRRGAVPLLNRRRKRTGKEDRNYCAKQCVTLNVVERELQRRNRNRGLVAEVLADRSAGGVLRIRGISDLVMLTRSVARGDSRHFCMLGHDSCDCRVAGRKSARNDQFRGHAGIHNRGAYTEQPQEQHAGSPAAELNAMAEHFDGESIFRAAVCRVSNGVSLTRINPCADEPPCRQTSPLRCTSSGRAFVRCPVQAVAQRARGDYAEAGAYPAPASAAASLSRVSVDSTRTV